MGSDTPSVGPDDLDECWCCGGLHDSFGGLCPNCDDAGCNRFTDECDSDHKPVMPDGGEVGEAVQMERHWIAVRGDRIVAKADTQARAALAADHLVERYEVVVAVPKGGVPSGPF